MTFFFFLLHAAKVRSSCEEGPGQSALQSAYHDPHLDVTELIKTEQRCHSGQKCNQTNYRRMFLSFSGIWILRFVYDRPGTHTLAAHRPKRLKGDMHPSNSEKKKVFHGSGREDVRNRRYQNKACVESNRVYDADPLGRAKCESTNYAML